MLEAISFFALNSTLFYHCNNWGSPPYLLANANCRPPSIFNCQVIMPKSSEKLSEGCTWKAAQFSWESFGSIFLYPLKHNSENSEFMTWYHGRLHYQDTFLNSNVFWCYRWVVWVGPKMFTFILKQNQPDCVHQYLCSMLGVCTKCLVSSGWKCTL